MRDSTRSRGASRPRATAGAAQPTANRYVHVEHSVDIELALAELSSALTDAPASWFPRIDARGVASIGVHVAGVPLRKKVKVEFGEPAKLSTWAAVPVSWKATYPAALFPVMTGKVAASSVGARRTRLTVSGVYQPPLAKLGEDLNQAVMQRVAKATVTELAEHIAERLKAGRR